MHTWGIICVGLNSLALGLNLARPTTAGIMLPIIGLAFATFLVSYN